MVLLGDVLLLSCEEVVGGDVQLDLGSAGGLLGGDAQLYCGGSGGGVGLHGSAGGLHGHV